MDEIWMEIPSYEGYYEASNTGQIRSIKRTIIRTDGKKKVFQSKVLKPWFSREHAYVGLNKGSKHKKELVHRLILLTFIGPCPNGHEGTHFPDRDTTNNRLDNLRWGTPKQNQGSDRVAQGTSNRGEN